MKPKALKLTQTALFAVIISACSMLCVPAAIPFTLQTFGVFLALFVMGGKYGTLSITVYVLLGAVGLPVFHGFSSGIGILLGSTGGYLLGFILSGLFYLLIMHFFAGKKAVQLVAAFGGMMICYIFGTVWFVLTSAESRGFAAAFTACVIPFIIPDTIKILLAFFLSKRIERISRTTVR